MNLIIALLLLAAPQDKIDRVILKQGSPEEGTVRKESPKEVELSRRGGTARIDSDDILRIEYYDMPAAYKGIFSALEEGRYTTVLSALTRSEEQTEDMRKAKDRRRRAMAPRKSWFDPAVRYYRALCFKELGEHGKAIKQLEDLVKNYSGSRFIKKALEWKVECHLESGDEAGANATISMMQKRSSELGSDLVPRAELLQAQMYVNKSKWSQAQRIFEKLSRNLNADVSGPATRGAIECYLESKNTSKLKSFCEGIIRTSNKNGPRLVASNGLAELHFKGKEYKLAVSKYVESVVLYNPGRGSELADEHEKALYRLAQSYERIVGSIGDNKRKMAYVLMAISTYRELSIEYASGRYREEAVDALNRLEKKKEDLKDS